MRLVVFSLITTCEADQDQKINGKENQIRDRTIPIKARTTIRPANEYVKNYELVNKGKCPPVCSRDKPYATVQIDRKNLPHRKNQMKIIYVGSKFDIRTENSVITKGLSWHHKCTKKI